MKSKIEIQQRLATENNALVIDILRWVLESKECPLCEMSISRELEVGLNNGEITSAYLEEKYGWTTGTVFKHMEEHLQYDKQEAQHMESMRKESIDTLDSAQDIVSRLLGWLDELEEVKEREGGITSEWVADATKLVSQANTSLRLVGQLKKEIGVDSQLLLAQKQMDSVMGVLVHVLRDQPQLLDQIELQVAALKPPSHIVEADFEVL